MLRQLFKSLRNMSGRHGAFDTGRADFELQDRAPSDAHLAVLFGSVRFGQESYSALLRRCAAETGTEIRSGNLFRRAQGGLNLMRYFVASLEVPGLRAECGVLRGLSASLMCHAAHAARQDFDGTGMYLFDSFERSSPPGEFEDRIPLRGGHGMTTLRPPFPANAKVDRSFEQVQRALAGFPGLDIRQGRIPEVLQQLPEAKWSFVHLDGGLCEQTLGGLEYFYSRLSQGGIIVTDGYDAPNYAGAHKAWDQFCGERDIAFIVLGTGQAVIIR